MGYGPEPRALRKFRELLEARRDLQQFGQGSSGSTWNGATACTHVILQVLALLYLGRYYTIDQISAKAGYYRERNSSGAMRGMTSSEFARACSALGLPYVVRFGLSFDTMHSYTSRGPVFLAVRHGSIPEWRDFVYFGTRADGKPNGYARRYGRTQLTGFESGAHAVLDGGSRPYYAESRTAEMICDTIVRRSPSIDGQKLGSVKRGDDVRVTGTETGSHWSGCGKDGTSWHRITSINGRSTYSRYGRAYAYVAAGLTTGTGSLLIRRDLWQKDPNHNSGSRPENPPYDVISTGQARREYNDHRDMLGRTLYGAIPTRSIP